jgi:hypothetical protein
MNKIYNLLYILLIALFIALILYAIHYYFGLEGFLDLVSYCKESHKNDAVNCMTNTLTCGFNKWSKTENALVTVSNIPTKTRKIIGQDNIPTGTTTLGSITNLVVEGCMRKFGNNESLVKDCGIETMRPLYTVMSTTFGRLDNATDYLEEPDCKGFAPKDKTHSGSSAAPVDSSSSTTGTTTGSSTTGTTTGTTTQSETKITMKDIEELINKSIQTHIGDLHKK